MTDTEWDNTPWAGEAVPRPTGRELVVPEYPFVKAVNGGAAAIAWANDVPLSVYGNDPQQKAARYLQAYKVGWFYKGGKKIAGDIAGLARTLSYEDSEGDNAQEIVAPSSTMTWEQLDPLEQFLRLMERPNPYQTGRTLFHKTQVRVDFAGMAFWYLDGAGPVGSPMLPTALYGISPSRMWPSYDNKGALIGWVMDKDQANGGVPFEAYEILPFIVPGVDEDIWTGQGVVEAVYANVPLSAQMAKHTSDVLTTGGRLAGMLWPRERALTEDEFTDAQRAWRNVASDPNAARRMLLFPEPMEYAAGAATPVEIGIPELATLTRDEILTAFPISPYQLGVPMPGGLNSAETRKEDRHDYWEGSIHPRVELLEETIQWGLVSRYEEAVGQALDFDIEEPNLDDAAKLIEKATAVDKLWALGFDEKAVISAAGLDHIEWIGKPEPPPPPPPMDQPQQVPPQQAPPQVPPPTKAEAVKARREDIIGAELPGFNDVMRAFLDDQAARIAYDIARTLDQLTKAQRKTAPDTWWNPEREDGLLREALRGLYVRLARTALGTVANTVDRIVVNSQVKAIVERMLTEAAFRITGINETTHKAVQEHLAVGALRGYSISQISNGVPHEDFPGLRTLPAFDDARAELVARTETMLGYNKSALLGYQEFNVSQVEAVDGDFDEVCQERNGQVFTLEEALAIEDHPNGTLDWVPISDKAVHDRDFLDALKAVAERPAPSYHFDVHPSEVTVTPTEAPVVNVTVPEPVVTVNQSAPAMVHVTVPEQPAPVVKVTNTVEAAKAPNVTVQAPPTNVNVQMPSSFTIDAMPTRVTKRVVTRREKEGISEVTDVETDA